jgi:hypothetical protein
MENFEKSNTPRRGGTTEFQQVEVKHTPLKALIAINALMRGLVET